MAGNEFGTVWQRLVFSQVRFGLLLVRSTISQRMPLSKVDSIYKIESNSAVAAVGLRFWFSPRSGRGTLPILLTPPLYTYYFKNHQKINSPGGI